MAVVKEEQYLLSGPAGTIEVAATVDPATPSGITGACAVVCHPHPLHGGTMDNKVVTTLVRAYRELGIAVARFNFRGVGESQGEHADGLGEVDDLGVVVEWLRERSGASRVLVAGFSFGSGVASNFCQRSPAVAHALFVAPPVGRYNFAPVAGYHCPVCVAMGDRDELVDAGEVYRWAQSLTPPAALIRIPEAGHFFHGQLVTLRQQLVEVIGRQLK